MYYNAIIGSCSKLYKKNLKPYKMNRSFTLVLFASFSLFTSSYAQTVYVDNGSAATYTLKTGDSLYVSNGTFTGKIKDDGQGGKVTIAASATFKPSSIKGFRSKYRIYGTAILPSFQAESGFGLENYGVTTLTGNTTINSGVQVWLNDKHASLYIKGLLQFNSSSAGSTFTNYGDVTVENGFTAYAAVSVINRSNFLISKAFALGTGQFQNEGYLYVKDGITLNNNATIINTCRMVSGKGITVNGGTIYNSGLLWASNEQNASAITNNNGTIVSLDRGVIKAVKFTNNGTIKGNGFMYLTGKTVNNGTGTVGVSGYTTDTLKVYTVNRSKTTQIFDDQWGTIYGNVMYAPFAAPDTLTASIYPCYQESSMIILPFEWKDFSVKRSGNIAVLNWSAQHDKGTLFEVQRSYNGKDFTPVAGMQQQESTAYQYADEALAATLSPVVYYRIKASTPTGKESYSEIRMIKFDVALSHVTASPNPFTSQVNISYTASQNGTVAVRAVNLQGQLQVVKQVNVHKGGNNIVIREAAGWGSGIYIIGISAENGPATSVKVIKQ